MTNGGRNETDGRIEVDESTLRILPVPFVTLYDDGRIGSWNPAAESIFGWKENEVLGSIPPFVPRSEEEAWREFVDRVCRQGSVEDVRVSLRTVRGRPIEASVTGTETAGATGSILVAIRDRTELIEQTNVNDLYTRVLRHDVRNELNLVLGYARMIAEGGGDDDDERAWAERIRESTRRVLRTTETARDLDRSLTASSEIRAIDLAEVVEPIVDDYRELFPAATITADLPETPARVGPSIAVAIENLIDNAIRHNDGEDARVDVRLETTIERGDRWTELVVADDGPGIPRAEREVLIEGTESPLQHGSGLGLWLVYWLVRKSNGELLYEPNDPRGSIVVVRLLAAEATDADPGADGRS